MASPPPTGTPAPSAGADRYGRALALLTMLFFMWGFITVLNDILIPRLKGLFALSATEAMLIQFTFFGAYFLLSLPAGRLIERVGYQRGIVVGLAATAAGALLFLPAASIVSYPGFLGALFVLAGGITVLQVAANPYVAVLGPPQTAAARLNLTQGINSLGTTLAPIFGAAVILRYSLGEAVAHAVTQVEPAWRIQLVDPVGTAVDTVRLPYLGLAATLVLLAVVFARVRLPTLERPTERTPSPDDTVLSHRPLRLGAVGIFLYVGAEVGIGSFIVLYFGLPALGGMAEDVAGAYLSLYWGAAMIGRFVGAAAQRRFPPAKVLAVAALAAMGLILITVTLESGLSVWTLLAVGFANSIMFPTIFTLSIEGLGERTSRGSGVLVMAIVGGAVVPVAMGAIADAFSYGMAIASAIPCYAYILYFALDRTRHGAR